MNNVSEEVNDNVEKVKPILRMKHISHLDLDGYGATALSFILQKHFPEDAMVLETCNIIPNKLYAEVQTVLENIDNYDLIVITDLSITQKVVDLIKNHPQSNKIRVFDHHTCDVNPLPENFTITSQSPLQPNRLTCATELYYNFIINDRVYGLIHDNLIRQRIRKFVELVRAYDTFDFWKYKDSITDLSNNLAQYERDILRNAPRLNTLFHILDRDEFYWYVMHDYYFNDLDASDYTWIEKVIDLEERKTNKYVESAIRRAFKYPFKYSIYKNEEIHYLDYDFAVIFAERSSPIIANTYLERNPDIDICAVVSNNQVSIYSIKNDIDVSIVAKIFNGGGHKEAAGFSIPYTNAASFNSNHFAKIIECAGNIAPEDDE